jgi:hypothetical protein
VAYALVGTAGTVSQGASGATVSPAFGASQSRTAGNLLIAVVLGTNQATFPATPSGWSVAKQQAGTSCSASIFYKVAAGADSAPSFSAPSTIISAALNEFSGNRNVTPADQSGGIAGTTSPLTATCTAVDSQNGAELLVAASVAFYSVAAPPAVIFSTVRTLACR